jgi:hypothetical protein
MGLHPSFKIGLLGTRSDNVRDIHSIHPVIEDHQGVQWKLQQQRLPKIKLASRYLAKLVRNMLLWEWL